MIINALVSIIDTPGHSLSFAQSGLIHLTDIDIYAHVLAINKDTGRKTIWGNKPCFLRHLVVNALSYTYHRWWIDQVERSLEVIQALILIFYSKGFLFVEPVARVVSPIPESNFVFLFV